MSACRGLGAVSRGGCDLHPPSSLGWSTRTPIPMAVESSPLQPLIFPPATPTPHQSGPSVNTWRLRLRAFEQAVLSAWHILPSHGCLLLTTQVTTNADPAVPFFQICPRSVHPAPISAGDHVPPCWCPSLDPCTNRVGPSSQGADPGRGRWLGRGRLTLCWASSGRERRTCSCSRYRATDGSLART